MDEKIESFFLRLKRLSKGERATLKHSVGASLTEAKSNALAVFYRCLPNDVPRYQEERWFAVACLQCLWDPDEPQGEPFEAIYGKLLASGSLSDSAGHRMESLLDTEWDADGYMLTKLIRLIKMVRQVTAKSPINCASLLSDLLAWNNKSRYVQKNWAKAIFAPYHENITKETEELC